jgi:hypothetical protein
MMASMLSLESFTHPRRWHLCCLCNLLTHDGGVYFVLELGEEGAGLLDHLGTQLVLQLLVLLTTLTPRLFVAISYLAKISTKT